MNERRNPEYYRALDEKLTSLLPDLRGVVSTESWRWFEEWIRAGEYGLAAEVAAEGLTAAASPPMGLCRDVLAAADMMGLDSEPIVELRSASLLNERILQLMRPEVRSGFEATPDLM